MDYLQQMTLEKLDTHIQQNESQVSLKLTQTEPQIKTIRPLEGSRGEILDDYKCGDSFLDTTPKTQSMKEIVKVDFIKIKTFCSMKDSAKRIRNTNYILRENICKMCI